MWLSSSTKILLSIFWRLFKILRRSFAKLGQWSKKWRVLSTSRLQLPEAVTWGEKKKVFEKFRKIHRKVLVPESFFNEDLLNFVKKETLTLFSSEFSKIFFKNTFFWKKTCGGCFWTRKWIRRFWNEYLDLWHRSWLKPRLSLVRNPTPSELF